MRRKSVFGISRNEAEACDILDGLKSAGFASQEISVLLPDKTGTRDFAHEKGSKAPEGAIAGVGTGGLVGGIFGWLVGTGIVAIPELGALLAAGPLLSALSAAAVTATVGGLIGSLIGAGIPEYKAKRYESRLREGRILIAVHSENAEQTRRAKEILERGGAEDISTAGEAAVREEDRDDHFRKAA